MAHIPNEDLLQALLEGPYSHFKKIGADDWRDTREDNPGFSLSSKGFSDFNSGESGSLYNLAKQHDLPLLNNSPHAGKTIPRTARTPQKKPPPVDVQKIWNQAKTADDPESDAAKIIRKYLTDTRKIPFDCYADLLSKGLIRFGEYRDEKMLLYPSMSAQNARNAMEGKPYAVTRLQRICVDDAGRKRWKKHLGSASEETAAFVIPPLLESDKKMTVITEGLEDALSIRKDNPTVWFFVATDKAGLKRTAGFFKNGKFASVMIIADYDMDQDPAITGQAEAWRLGEKIKSFGIERVPVRMPPKPKDDANQALQEGRLSEWADSLIEIPEPFRIDEQGTRRAKELPQPTFSLRMQRASEVVTRPIEWLWPGVLALGKLVVIAGDPGLGKSQVALFICATVSRAGEWPVSGDPCKKGNVLILSAEDGAADTIVPRLKALDADLDRVHIIHAVRLEEGRERSFDLTMDVDHLRRDVERIGDVKLLVVDPLSAYLGNTDSHRNAEVRAALTPAVEFAEKIGACLLCVTHLNKGNQGNALSRVIGSVAFTAAARASFVVTRDEDHPERRLMLPLKINLAKDVRGYAYHIEEKSFNEITTSRICWENDFVELSADDVLSSQGSRAGNRKAAENFLYEELGGGSEVPCRDLYERAKDHGISRKVLWSAKESLGVQARKTGFSGGWVWSLPNVDYAEDSQDSQNVEDSRRLPNTNGNLGGIFDERESSQDSFTEVF